MVRLVGKPATPFCPAMHSCQASDGPGKSPGCTTSRVAHRVLWSSPPLTASRASGLSPHDRTQLVCPVKLHRKDCCGTDHTCSKEVCKANPNSEAPLHHASCGMQAAQHTCVCMPRTLTLLSSLAVASRRPLGANAQQRTAAVCALSTVERPSAVGRHSRTCKQGWSVGENRLGSLTSPAHQRTSMCSCTGSQNNCTWSHITQGAGCCSLLTVLSQDAEATRL